MTTILMIRHGQTTANRDGIFAGNTDAALVENGIEQARKTAEYVAANYNVAKVYASDLQRAYNTGKAIADLAGVEIVADKRLREIYAGQWENIKYSVLEDRYADSYSMWLGDIGKARCDGGESVKELSERVMSALTEIASANDGKTVVVATHATPVRAMRTLAEYGNLDKMQSVPWVTNASVTVFEYDNGTWKCIEASNDAHLKGLKTSLPKNV